MQNKHSMFYEINKDKAIELIARQIADNWTDKDIIDYWHSLDYDIFFVNSVVKPAIKIRRG